MRKSKIVFLGPLLAMLCGTALADPPSVERYYSKTYNGCMNEAAGSTLPMRQCIGVEHDAWDKQLNQVYQALMASRSAPQKTGLRDDERAWLKRTQHQCDHAGDDEAGGTLQGVEVDQCYLDETIRRTVYLRGLH
jgi:uncharacterized protein YecT (DUF1311 family)